MNKPSLPSEPDLEKIHDYLKGLDGWLKNLHVDGTQFTFATQEQINKMQDLKNAGKGVFNSTTGKINVAQVVSGVINWKEL